MQKLNRMCINRLMFVLSCLDIPPRARKIFLANLMASFAAPLLSEARCHQYILDVDVES